MLAAVALWIVLQPPGIPSPDARVGERVLFAAQNALDRVAVESGTGHRDAPPRRLADALAASSTPGPRAKRGLVRQEAGPQASTQTDEPPGDESDDDEGIIFGMLGVLSDTDDADTFASVLYVPWIGIEADEDDGGSGILLETDLRTGHGIGVSIGRSAEGVVRGEVLYFTSEHRESSLGGDARTLSTWSSPRTA